MSKLAMDAYNATKADGDPDYFGVTGDYRAELETRADHVVSSGLTTTPFEEKVKELHEKEKAEEPKTPLGAVNTLEEAVAEEGPVETAKDTEEKRFDKMTREELDAELVKVGLNPADHANKQEAIASITAAKNV